LTPEQATNVVKQLSGEAAESGSGIYYDTDALYVPKKFVAQVDKADPDKVSPVIKEDPVQKLKTFLANNPDVAAVLKG
jgi:hypothetical protein